jgi:phage gp16-like protein
VPSTGNKNRNKKQSGTDKYRGAELAKIHIARKDLGLDEDIYRDIIREASQGKTESAGDLDWTGRRAVLNRFRELGWKDKPSVKAKSGRRLANDPQSRMLRGLWIELHKAGKVSDPSEAALCKFIKRMTGKDALQWLSDRDVTVVKKALTDWLER